MKLLIVLCLTASLAAIAVAIDAAWGQRTGNDSAIFKHNIAEGPDSSHMVTFISLNDEVPNKITAIFVHDNFANKSGAVPRISVGGPGHNHTVLILEGEHDVGYNSNVEIYAY